MAGVSTATVKGGAQTATPSMDNVADLRDAKNVLIKNGRWENVLGATTISSGGPTANVSLYPYFFHSTSVPVTTTTKVLAAGTISGTPKIRNMTDSADVVTLTAGGNPVTFETVKEKCYFSDGATQPQVIDGQNGMATYFWGIPAGIGAPFGGYPSVTASVMFTYNTGFTDKTMTFAVSVGSPTITVEAPGVIPAYSGSNMTGVNQTIWLNGDEQTAPGNRFSVTGFIPGGVGVGQFSIDPVPTKEQMQGATGGPVNFTGVTSQVNFGNMTWTTGAPKYTTTYYDSTRGHSGNMGAVYQPAEPVKYNVSLIITVTGDHSGWLTRCDQILLWSTSCFSIGGNYNTLAQLTNTSGGVTIDDNRGDDSQLGTLVGPFQVPQENNNPPKYFSQVCFWNGVMWGLGPTGPLADDFDLSLLYYSRKDDPQFLGRGEESWPLTNFLRIPAKDGRGLGLVIVGDSLCVLTERYIYAVSGWAEGSYNLVKLSAKGLGIGQFQMSEYTGDGTSASAAMIFLGQDRMVWAQAPGDIPVYLSKAVQDQLDTALRGSVNALTYPDTRVHYITYSGDTYAVILLN